MGPSGRWTTGDLDRELADLLDGASRPWDAPGLAIGVLHGDAVGLAAAGLANVETGQPVTPATRFRIGSVTKPFTATLAMTLVEEGRMVLDNPIAAYLPVAAPATGPRLSAITLRHLLTHTGGIDGEFLADGWADEGVLWRCGAGDDALDALLSALPALRQLVAPGAYWAYCNSGYWVVGAAIARILGVPFETAMRERVLAPLGLERTSFSAAEPIASAVAVGHHRAAVGGTGESWVGRPYRFPRARNPSGGLIATVADLLRFAAAHRSPPHVSGLLGNASLAEMRAPQARFDGMKSWGLGWARDEPGGVTVLSHSGGTNGFTAQLAVVPERPFAVAVLTNGEGSETSEELVERALARWCALPAWPPPPPRVGAPHPLVPYAGRYRWPWGEVRLVAADAWLDAEVTEYDEIPGAARRSRRRYLPCGEHTFVRDGSPGDRLLFVPAGADPGDPHLVRFGGEWATRVAAAESSVYRDDGQQRGRENG